MSFLVEQTDVIERIAVLSKFPGHWELSDALADVFNVPLATIKAKKPSTTGLFLFDILSP